MVALHQDRIIIGSLAKWKPIHRRDLGKREGIERNAGSRPPVG